MIKHRGRRKIRHEKRVIAGYTKCVNIFEISDTALNRERKRVSM